MKSCLVALRLALAFAVVPLAAQAAPVVVTYDITGGSGFGRPGSYDGRVIQSGTVVVTFPNPGSGSPPINSANASIYVSLQTADTGGGFPGVFRRTFQPTLFPTGFGYRGILKTLRALRSRPFMQTCTTTPYYGSMYCTSTGYEKFSIRADAGGQITRGFFGRQATNTDTAIGFNGITGQEVAAAPEPAFSPLLTLAGGIGAALALAAGWTRRRAA
jgi:hypothetical protein